MKFFFFLIILSLSWVVGFSQKEVTICGTFISPVKLKVKFFEPVNGYYNMSFYSNSLSNNYINNNLDSFSFKTKIDSPVTVRCYVTDEKDIFITKSEIVIFPGDSIHLRINLEKKIDKAIQYNGSNSEGHALFNAINYSPVFKYQKVLDRLDTLSLINKNTFKQDINEYINDFTDQFENLYKQNRISKSFFEYYKVAFKQLLYDIVIEKFLGNYKRREVFTKVERDNIISDFYKEQPVSNSYSKSIFNSYFYILEYYNFLAYKELNLQSIDILKQSAMHSINGIDRMVNNFCSQFLYIHDKNIQEDLWAIQLLLMLTSGAPEPLGESIQLYRDIFKQSKWDVPIDKVSEDANQSDTISYVLQNPIKFIDLNQEAKSLHELLKLLPENKPVFIDLWASWCGPCITTFQFNRTLDSFLLLNKVERLYITLDGLEHIKSWQNAIEKYSLGGYHTLPSAAFIEDIRKLYSIPQNGPISIPKYIFISANKQIISTEIFSPNDLENLQNQILELLRHH